LTISSKDGLIAQEHFFNKLVSSKDLSGYYLLKKGEFAYNKSYSVGYDFGSIKRLELYEKGALSTLYICFSVKYFRPEYIRYYFDSLKWYKEIYLIAAEGARNHGLLNVPTESFFETKHLLSTNLMEQAKIANFLSLIDQRIEKQRQLVESLKKYKRGLFIQLYNQSSKNKIQIKNLGEYFSAGILSKDDLIENGSNPCILYGELFTKYNEVIQDICSFTNKSLTTKTQGTEILFPSSTTVDALSLICPSSINQSNVILGGDLFAIRLKKDFDNDFMSYLFNYIYKRLLAKFAQGITIVHLHYSDIKEQFIEVPNVDEQIKIIKIVNNIEKYILKNEKIHENLKSTKQGLLQQMFI